MQNLGDIMIHVIYVIKCKCILQSFTSNGKACFASTLLQVGMQDVAGKLPMVWNTQPCLRPLSSRRKINVIELMNFSKKDKVNSELWLLRRSDVLSFTLGRKTKTAIQFKIDF